MTKWDLESHIILEVVHGSHAYGLNTPESDLDIRGVAIPPVTEYFGMAPPWEQVVQNHPTDRTIWNLQKFMRLAAVGNPNVLEILSVPESCVRTFTGEGWRLLEARDRFLSRKVEKSFLGYAKSQFLRMERSRRWLRDPLTLGKTILDFAGETEDFQEYLSDCKKYEDWKKDRNPKRAALETKCGYDAKHFSHCLRLLVECIGIFDTGHLTVRLSAVEQEYLLAAKKGNLPYEGLLERYQDLEARCQEAILANKAKLPDEPDWGFLNNLCVDLTKGFLSKKS